MSRRHWLSDERMHEECGLFGIDAPGEDVANLTYFGLYALQHRGQESAGIATADGASLRLHKDMGLVAQAFDQAALERLTGHLALGHTRYSTTGSNRLENAQPIVVEHPQLGPVAIAHNGNLTNAEPLRRGLEHEGVRFKTSSDTEVIAELLARTSGLDLLSVLRRSLPRLQGAYCLLVLTRDSLVGVRDPLGIRPLCLGRLPDGGAIMASETCALDTVGAELVREIEPGEAVLLGQGPPKAEQLMPSTRKAMCMFEFIYFARPDSRLQGQSLYEARRNMGRELAREAPADADIVILQRGPDQEPLHHPHLHPAEPAASECRHQAQVQPVTRDPRWQARGAGRRFDRARHHQPEDRRRAAAGRDEIGAHAGQQPADPVALFHGDRHRHPVRADCIRSDRRGSRAADRRRLPEVPEQGGTLSRRQERDRLLHGVLRR